MNRDKVKHILLLSVFCAGLIILWGNAGSVVPEQPKPYHGLFDWNKVVKAQEVKPEEKPVNCYPQFCDLYLKAGKTFNVPWQILEAVHQVETGKRGDTKIQSYAGATGPMQFMPKTWEKYKVDGDGDGKLLITDVDDAMFSAANNLSQNGIKDGRFVDALWHYNHSMEYVNKVLGIAEELGFKN